jgi:hypothetical protein
VVLGSLNRFRTGSITANELSRSAVGALQTGVERRALEMVIERFID